MSESANSEQKAFLWVLECFNGYCHELIPLYAATVKEAKEKAQKRIQEAANRAFFTHTTLTPYPEGFPPQRRESALQNK